MPRGGVLRLRINRDVLPCGYLTLEQESIAAVAFASVMTVLVCSCGPKQRHEPSAM